MCLPFLKVQQNKIILKHVKSPAGYAQRLVQFSILLPIMDNHMPMGNPQAGHWELIADRWFMHMLKSVHAGLKPNATNDAMY